MRSLTVFALLAALVAGCGAEETELFDPQRVAERTSNAASARIAMTVKLAADEAPPADEAEALAAMNFSATGAIDDHGRLFQLAYTMDGTALGLEAGDVNFDAVLDMESGDAYFDYPGALDLGLPAGKRWVHMQVEELEGLQSTSDPSSMVAYLYAASDLERVGEERVRGVDTVRYRATMHLDRALEQFPENQRKQMQKSFEMLEEFGIETIPMEVWIDTEDYLRRLDMDWRMDEVPDAPKGARLEIEMEMWDYGADVDVKLPAKSTVVELEDLEG
jgi:hypothetical protein